jgi:hypothetical protein
MEDDTLTDKEREFLARKKNKDKMTTVMRAKEAAWLRRENERSLNRLPNEYRSFAKAGYATPSKYGKYGIPTDD